MKTLVLVLTLLLGSSLSSSRYFEDSSERLSEHQDDDGEVQDEREMFNEEEEEEDEESDEAEDGNDDDEGLYSREQIVNIQPGQSLEESEDEDEDKDVKRDDVGRRPEFEDTEEGDDDGFHDRHHIMEGNEGDLSLDEPDLQGIPDEEGFDEFTRRAEEISKENESIKKQIHDLEKKFDEALSLDNEHGNTMENDLHA